MLEFIKYLFLRIFLPRSCLTMEWQMLRMLNQERKRAGLKIVTMQFDLRQVARRHSRDMGRNNYFDHINQNQQNPKDRLTLGGVSETTSAENLAKIAGYSYPCKTAHHSLMNSPGHRTNILNRTFNTVGIGIVKCEKRVFYFTQNFAYRQIIFTKKIPKKVVPGEKIMICGQAFENIKQFLCQIIRKNKPETLSEIIQIRKNKFSATISITNPGEYELNFYTKLKEKTAILSNSINIKVKQPWYKLLF